MEPSAPAGSSDPADSEDVLSVKIICVGDSAVGKSKMLER